MGSLIIAMLIILTYISLLFLVKIIYNLFLTEYSKLCMGNSLLKLNENKTEVIIFGSPDISSVLGPLTPYQKSVVKNLRGIL